ncbi:MAG TPA: ABC transporter permease subunit [Opitutaceae bacterium]|nr:ABC transporter permease subunit [Opitutaceae bacterium]HRJ45809.1 ABC transporter permease subunit [Opitutaceae bacterium]
MRRVWLIAAATLRESLQHRSFALLLLAALAFVAGTLFLRQFNFGSSELKFVADLGFGMLSLGAALLAIAMMTQVFFDECERRTLHLLLARGVSRSEFLLGKLAGVALLLGLYALMLLACLWPVLWARETALLALMPDAFDRGSGLNFAGVMIAAYASWLKACVLAAAVLWLATLAENRVFAMGCGLLLLIIFHSAAVWAAYGSNGGWPVWLLHGLGYLLPDFGAFDLTPAAFAGDGGFVVRAVRLTLYAVLYGAIFIGLGVLQLRRREI